MQGSHQKQVCISAQAARLAGTVSSASAIVRRARSVHTAAAVVLSAVLTAKMDYLIISLRRVPARHVRRARSLTALETRWIPV